MHLDSEESPAPEGSLRPRVGEPVVSGRLKGGCPHCGAVRTHPWPGATGPERGPGRLPARERALTPGDSR
ncbi:hypothetical protein ACWEQO_05005 [Streptomyces sp. NPDC004051]